MSGRLAGLRRSAAAGLTAALLVGVGPAAGELPEPPSSVSPEPTEAATASGRGDAQAALRALLERLWRESELAPTRPVALRVVGGLGSNAVAASRTVAMSREYLEWVGGLPDLEWERVVARTLAHELAHIALGHGLTPSPEHELEAEALGIRYFERAGFDCRWWVAYVRAARETSGQRGWPPLHRVIEHDREACARARGALGRDTQEVSSHP